MKQFLGIFGLLCALLFVVGCVPVSNTESVVKSDDVEPEQPTELPAVPPPPAPIAPAKEEVVVEESVQEVASPEPVDRPDWQDVELTNVLTDQTFSVSDYEVPVLVESFAVWCPTCTKQQREIIKLHEQVGDAIVSIGLNTDPNEDASAVKDHAESNGFDWAYVVAPTDVTQELIDTFGVRVVSAPSVPMIVVCPDGAQELLSGSGVKSTANIIAAVESTCDYAI